MTHDVRTFHIRDDGELAGILDLADSRPVRLEKGGVMYRLVREDLGMLGNYDPDAVQAVIREASGMLTPEQGQEMKEYLYRAREEGTRPADRP